MVALYDLCWNFLFSRHMICKQHIIFNHMFFRYKNNLEPVTLPQKQIPVADPGFPRGGGANLTEGHQHMILPNSPKNCIKLKEFGPGGRGEGRHWIHLFITYHLNLLLMISVIIKPSSHMTSNYDVAQSVTTHSAPGDRWNLSYLPLLPCQIILEFEGLEYYANASW